MHWIGDEDRSLSDVMLVGGRLILIDNGLCGPGSHPQIRGYHPLPDCSPDRIAKKCYGGGKYAFVEFVLRDAAVLPEQIASPGVIERIEELTDEAVRAFVGASRVEAWVADVLNNRNRTLRADYTEWLKAATRYCS